MARSISFPALMCFGVLFLLSGSMAKAGYPESWYATRCDGCTDEMKQTQAIAAAPRFNGVYDVYVADNAALQLNKYQVEIANEPGLSYVRALLVENDAEVGETVAAYWSSIAALESGPIQVPGPVSPTLIDFLGNPARFGDTRGFLVGRLAELASFPANATTVITQFFIGTGRVPALKQEGIVLTLQFPDGGTVQVELTVHIDSSTEKLGITEVKIIPDSAYLDGVSVPTSPNGFAGYERMEGPASGMTIAEIARLARMRGISVTCATTGSRARLRCNPDGSQCWWEVVGTCF